MASDLGTFNYNLTPIDLTDISLSNCLCFAQALTIALVKSLLVTVFSVGDTHFQALVLSLQPSLRALSQWSLLMLCLHQSSPFCYLVRLESPFLTEATFMMLMDNGEESTPLTLNLFLKPSVQSHSPVMKAKHMPPHQPSILYLELKKT